MRHFKRIAAATALAFGIVGISAVLPVQTQPQPASASQPVTKCPEPTEKGAYFERGHDKDGNVLCGFAYYNPCPYFEAAEAGTPECEKGKPTEEQLKPWVPTEPAAPAPEQTPVNQCGGK